MNSEDDLFFQFGSRNSNILNFHGNSNHIAGKEGSEELTGYLTKIEPDILNTWFEAHNNVTDGIFFASDFRPSHVVSLLLTIERSDFNAINPDYPTSAI